MKKFMIFLLMVFLYLGTCQARSEAKHFSNAGTPLPSWVTSSSSHSYFMDLKAMDEVVVSITPTQPQSIGLAGSATSRTYAVAVSGLATGESVSAYKWYVDGSLQQNGTGTTFELVGGSLAAGTHQIKCEAVTNVNTYTSNIVILTVSEGVVVNIVGPDHACESAVVTFTAQVENNNIAATYQWRRDGQFIVGATDPTYSFAVNSTNLPGLSDTLTYEFDVQVNRNGCETQYSPVHYFSVSPKPVDTAIADLFCEASHATTITAYSFTSGSETPYMWNWKKGNEITTTYTNTITMTNVNNGDQVVVFPIYQNYSCNPDSAVVTLQTYENKFGVTGNLSIDVTASPAGPVCAGELVKFTVKDNNTNLGNATYTWYMDGQLIAGVTDTVYAINLYDLGTHSFQVYAAYDSFPCQNPVASTTVTVEAAPTLVSVTGNNVICSGDSTLLTVNAVNAAKYAWSTDPTTEVTTNTLKVPAGVYTVTVSSTNGCKVVSDPFTVTAFGADVQVNTTSYEICKGESVTLNANADGWTGNVTYKWSTGATSPTIHVSPNATTTYTVTSTMDNIAACNRVDSIVVTVNNAPTAPTINADATICAGSLLTLTATPNSSASYIWYLDGFQIQGENLSVLNFTLFTPGDHSFSVRAVSDKGCVSDISQAKTVTVEAAPTLVTITGDNVICEGDSTLLTANAIDAAKYAWSTDPTTEVTTNTLKVPAGVYAVTVSSTNGCKTVSDPFTVYAFGTDVQVVASETAICKGDHVTLNVNQDGWTGNVAYTWSVGNNHAPSIDVAPETTTTYSVTSTVTSTSGVLTTCQRVDSIRVIVFDLPEAPTATAAPKVICEGAQSVITATPATHAAYIWYQDGVEIPGENQSVLRVTPSAGVHTYSVKAVNTNNCVSANASKADTVTVEAAPTLVTITGDNVLCENDSTILTVSAVGAETYKWSNDSTKTTIKVPAGVYTVTAYSKNGCATVSDPFTVTTFGSDVQVTATRTAICQGEHVTLNVNADGWTGNVTYQWDAKANNATTPSVDVAPAQTTTYMVTSTVTSTSGVNNAACQRVDSIKIVVFDLPKATKANIVGNDTICQGAQAVVSAAPADHANYLWYVNGVEILGEHLSTLTVMPDAPGMYIYNFKAINESGCVSDTVSKSDTLIVLANPTVQITGDPMICHDSVVKLYAFINDTTNTMANNHNYSYSWRLYNYTLQNGDNMIDGKNINVSLIGNDTLNATLKSQDHPYIFTAFTTNDNGCVAESDPYYVYVGDTIHVAVTLDYDTVCQGGEVTATAHLGDYNMWPLVYQWHEIANGHDSIIPHGTERIYTTHITSSKTVLAVDVTNNLTGCTATGTSDTVVVMNPVVDAVVLTNGINGNDTTDVYVCEGATINVVAYLKDDAGNRYVDSTLHYVWKQNGFLMPLVTGPYFTKQVWILDEDSTHYTYEVYIDYGMSGCTEVARTSNTVHVKRNPIVDIAGVHHICYQDASTFNVHLTGWVDGVPDTNAIYKWYRNGRLTSNDQAYANYYNEIVPPTYNDPIIYKLEVINGDGCSSFSPEFEVNVHEAPETHITASDTLICKGGDVTLNANLNNYNENMLTFQWYENQPNAAHKMLGYTHEHETITNLQQTTTYYVEVIHLMNDNTNENFVCASYDNITVRVVDDPVIDSITTDLPDTMVLCDGRSVTMTAHVSGGIAGGEVFTWYRNGEIVPNATAAVFTETVHAENNYPTVYEYAVSVAQAGTGCESAVTFDTVRFTVYPNPTLAIETDPFVCQETNNNIMMVAHVDPIPATDYSFTWYEDNAPLTGATGTHSDTMYLTRNYRDYAYNFSVSLVNAYGCQATAETQVYVDTVPVINITATETNICVGGEITLTANLNNWNTPNMQYQWFDTTSAIAGATSLTYTVVPTQGTHKYTFKALQLNSLCNATSNEVTVTVNADPTIDSVTNDLPASKTLCDGRSVTFTAHVSGGVTGGEVYTWYRNGDVIPNAVEATYTETPHAENNYPTTYIYEVSVKQTAAGCESIVKIADTVTVTPNPTLAIETDPFVCQETSNNITMVAHVDPAPTTDYTFAWYEDNAPLTGATGVHKDTIVLTRNYRDYAYNFNVALVNAYGCQATAETHVYVDTVPVINITATETNICVGGEITLTANLNNWNTPNMQYQWFDTTSAIAGATSLTYTVVPTQGTHKYTFKALQLNSLCNATSNEVTVTVNADPTIDSVTNDLPASKTLCDGRSVTFTAHVSGGVTGGEVYTWYRNGEVIPNAVDATYTETPHAVSDYPTNYTYSVSVKQTAAGCESTVTFADTLTVVPNPTLAIETDPFVCQETSNNITMVAHVDPAPTTDYTFTWYEDNAPLTGATGVHKDTIVLTRNYRDYAYNFSVSLVNAYGCQATAETQVYVDTVPVINITATETNICVGGEITLTANLNNWNTPNMQYQWFDTTSAIAGATSLTYTVVPTQGTHKYTFKALQLNSLCNATSNEVTVTVNADPTIDSVTNDLPASKTLCDGRSVTFTAHVSGGVTGGEVYTWYRNGDVIAGATEATYTETPHAENNYPTTYIYKVSVAQAAAGCESSIFTLSTVTVNPNPTLAIETDPIVCQETSNNITMIAHVDPAPTTDYTFTWYEDNAPLTGATGVHKDTIVLTRNYRDYAYNFSVSLVNEYGCQATAETQVYVDTVPVINITATETSICDGGLITLTANLNNWNTGNMQYQWFDNDTVIAGATSLTYTVAPAHGTHDYTFKALQLNSLCHATSNTVTVTVNDDPIIASVVMSDTIVCEGAQITLTAVPQNYTADNSDVYTWYRNGILMQGATGRVITDSPVTVDQNTQQFTYTAVVTRAAAGCESAPVSSAALTVYRNPIVQITGDQHVCETSPIYLIANVDTTGRNVGILHYTWYESGQLRDNLGFNLGDNQFYSEYFYARTEPYRFTVNVEREGVPAGCASMSSEYLVYVYPQPVVNITATETEICTDGEVTFTAHLNDPNAQNMTYQWYEIRNRQEINAIGRNADGSYIYDTINTPYRYEIPGATSPVYTSQFTATTTVGVVVFQTNSTCSDNDEIVITVNPKPVVTAVTVNNGQSTQTVCNGAQITVAATIDPANAPGAVYTWFRDNELIPGATQSTYSENVFTTDNQITNHVYSAIVTLPMSGCVSLMSTNNATVTVKPAPATVSISGDNVLCENDSTVLTAYSDVPGSFTWSNGDTTNTTTVTAGVYTVTLTTPEGCEKTSDPFTVTAFGAEVQVVASETAICEGEHVTLYAHETGWTGNVTYTWENGSHASSIDVQPLVTTTYMVTSTVNSTSGTCSRVDSIKVIVTPLPAKLTITTPADTICQNQQYTLTANITDLAGYIWYQNGVEIPGENQASLTVNFPAYGVYNFSVKGINDQGCVSAQASDPVAVTVTPAPSTVTITGDNVICENDSTVLTAHSDVPGTFTWNDGTTGVTKTVAAGIYNVTMTTAEGCSMTSDNFTVTAFGSEVQVTASETAICEGEHVTLYANENGWTGNVTYTWENGSHASSIDVQPLVTTTYMVTSTVNSTSGSCQRVDSITVIVTKLPAKLTITTPADTICQNQQYTLTANVTDLSGYIWYQNGVEIPGENQASLTVNFPAYGVYNFSVKGINDQGCVSAQASDPVAVTVTPAPSTVTITGNNVICENDSTVLTAHSDVLGTFTWNDGTTGATKTVTAGIYNVTMTTAEGCSMTSDNFEVTAFGSEVQVLASETSICAGEHVTLYAHENGWTGNVAYTWENGSHASSIDVQPTETTTYMVTSTVTSTSGTCQRVDSITVIVHELPGQLTVTTTTARICQGDQAVVNATPATEAGYIWYLNGVEIPGENQSQLRVDMDHDGIYNFSAKAINTEGCISAVASAPVTVTVTPAPTTVTISGNNVICENDSTVLTAYSDVTGTFTWSDGTVGATNTVTAGVYTVTMRTAEGCEMTSAPFTVTAFGSGVQVVASQTAICAGEHVTLYANETGWTGNVAYTWENGSHASSIDVTPAVTTTYMVTSTVTSTSGTCQRVDSITVVVTPLPDTVHLTALTRTIICQNDQVTIHADGNAAGYIWYQNGVEIPGENQADLTVNFPDYGTYNFAAKAVNAEGCVSAVASDPLTVTVTKAPTTVTITGNNVICENDSTTLLAHSDVMGTFTWSDGTVGATNTVTAGVYTVTIETRQGCQLTSAPFTVTAFGSDVQVVASQTAICAGEHVTLYANETGWTGNVAYTWENGSHASSIDVTPAVTTTYMVTSTVTSTSGTCQRVDSITVVVTPLPDTVHLNATTPTTICQNGQVTIHADGNAAGYIWYQNGVEIPGENQADLTVNFPDYGTYNFAAKAINVEGCVSKVASEPITVTVNKAPTTVTISGNNVICENDSTVLYAYSDVTGTFTWSNGTVGATNTVTAGVYTVTMRTAEGCEMTSAPFTVTAFGSDVQVVASQTAICAGEHVTLYANETGWTGNVAYTWENGSHASSIDVTPAVTTTYMVTSTVTSTSGTCQRVDSITVVVTPLPDTVHLNATTPTTICQNGQVTIHADGNAAGYIWYQNGVEIPGENQADLTVNFPDYGTYNFAAKAVNAEGCVSAVASDPLTVTVTKAPTTVTISGDNIICENDVTTLTAYSDVTGTFTWSNGTVGATNVVNAGTYTVTMRTAEGCEMTSAPFTVQALGTDLFVTASETSICRGEHTTLYANQNGWSGNVSYAWNDPTNSTSTTVDVQPDSTTTYTVTATVTSTNGNAGSCTAIGTVTIIVNQLPDQVVVSPSATTVCEGEQVTFRASGNAMAYIWYENGVEIPGENQATLTVNFPTEGAYTYAAKAINVEGCISAIASTPVTVTVNAAPDAVVVSGQTTICNGGHTTLYANVTPNTATATYQWFKDGVAITGANGYFLTVDAAGSYKVEATTNGCTTVSDAVVVTVEDTPQIQLTATESTICLGGSTVITAEPTGWNVYNVNHNWNNGFQGTAYTFVPTTAGTFTFSDTASQAISGCAAVGTITITVNPAPATPMLTINNSVVCEGGRVVVTDTTTRTLTGTPVYTWFRNNVEIPGETFATLVDYPAVVGGDATTYTYTAIVTYPASGCVSAVSAAATVTVNPEPNVVVNMAGNAVNGMICEGGTVTFTAAVMPANGTYQYQWLLNNVVIPGETNPTLTVSPNANDNAYNYSVIVTSAPGCFTEQHAAPLTVVPNPILTIADANGSNDISVCEGGSATFYATVENGVAGMAGYTIAWYNTESTTPLGFGPSYTAIDTVGTYSYYAVVTSPYGCMSQSNHYITYRVVADPVVTIDYEQGADTIICAGGTTTLTAYVTGGIGATSYQWYNGNRAIAGATGQTYTIDPVNDNVALGYHVVVTQEGVDCQSTSANFNVNVAAPYNVTIANAAGVVSGYYSTCPGGTVTLVANIPNVVPGDVPTYQWYYGNGQPIYGATSSTFTTPTLSLNDRIDYYLVVNSTISGCSFTTNSITVEVLPAPEVEIRGAHTVCENSLGLLNLNAYVTGGVPGAAYTYTWQVRNGSNVITYPATTSPTFTPNLPANDAASIYTITVTIDRTDNTGCTAVSAPFELNVIAAPSVTLTASDATVCAGGNVTFTATVPNGVVYDYTWTINGTLQQNVNANTITVPATGSSMTASVTVSQSGASAACSATATLAVPVQVVAVPTVTIAANHTQMCAGDGANAIISVASVTGGIPGANYTYEWTENGNALTSAVGSQITRNFAAPGVYTYQLVLNGNLGCSSAASAPVTIEVAAQPTVTLTSLSGLNICEGGDVDLTATVTNFGSNIGGVQNSTVYGNMSFNWLRNGVTTQFTPVVTTASQSLNQTLNTVDNYTYTVVVTPTGYNCQPATSNDVMISVVNDPTWTDVHVYTADICLGDALRLEANITGGVVDASDNSQGQIVWTYVMSDGTTGTVPGIGGIVQEFTPSAAGSYTFIPTWVGNIGSGCQLTNSASVQQPVTVHELPTAAFTNADNQIVCGNVSGSSVMLEITFTGTAPYTFDIVNMTTGEVLPYHLSSSNVYTFYVSPEATSIYRIENLMDGNACGNAQLGFGAQTTVVVNDIDFEQTMFISGCDNPGEVTFTFNVVSGDPSALAVLTYAHDPANPLYATINNNSVTFSAPTTPGDYPAVLTVQGCDYDVVVRVLVDEYDLGGKFMDQRWDNVAVINNNPNTNGGYTFTSFQWYHNGELIPGAVYSNYEDKDGLNGWYSVEVSGKDSSGNAVTFMTCEVYFSSASHIKVYPVPANVLQEVTIELDLTTEELQGAVLDIYDVTGKLINHITELNPVTKVAGFKAQGTYFGRILTGTNEIKTVKFVIVK